MGHDSYSSSDAGLVVEGTSGKVLLPVGDAERGGEAISVSTQDC